MNNQQRYLNQKQKKCDWVFKCAIRKQMDLVKDSTEVITCRSMHHSKQHSGSCN